MSIKKRICVTVVALILLTVTGFSTALAVPAAAAVETQEQKLYDFAHVGSPSNKTIDTVGLVELYLASLEESLSQAEREFLESFGRITLTYCDIVTTDKIAFDYDEAAELLTVTPKSYTYKGADGVLAWSPVSVTVGGEDKTLAGGSAVFSMDSQSYDNAEIEVTYNATAPLAADEINEIINLYHDTAKYSYELKEYEIKRALYAEYVHAKRLYDDALIEYNEYLSDLTEYEERLGLYEAYVTAMDKYTEDQQKYLNYLAELELYEERQASYEEYLKTMEKVREHLLALDITKTEMTDGRSLYAAVMGRTVDEVIENKTLLTGSTVGADPVIVDLAGDATGRVRSLLTNYFECKTITEKYNYYIVNYENLCTAFRDLTISLDELYQNRKVRGILISEGKDKKYIILVAQLVLVTTALIDGEVTDYDGAVAYGSSWTIEKKTILQILENKTYITDTDSRTPLAEGVPSPIEKPTAPENVSEPVLTEKVQQPIMPDEVENPGEAPTERENPTIPTPVTDAAGLIYQTLGEEDRELIASIYAEGSIATRTSDTEFRIPLVTTVKRSASAKNITVIFVSENDEPLYSVTVSTGSTVIYEGALPTKAEDDFYSYKFMGWKDEQGNTVNLMNIGASVRLTPVFENQPKYYDITWCVDGKTVTENLPADTMPESPLPLEKADTGSYMYVFDGWDKPIELVGKNITYTAVYKKQSIFSIGKTHVEISDDGRNLVCTAYAAFETEFSVKELLLRASGARGIVINAATATVEISYAQVIEMHRAGVELIKVNTLQKGSGAYNYSVELFTGGGERITAPITCVLTLPCTFASNGYATLFTYEAEEKKYVKFSGEKNIRFTASCGKTYIVALEYAITAASTSSTGVSCDKTTAIPGERVTVSITIPEGMELSQVIITTAEGEKIKLNTDGTFVMPSGNVTVGAVAKYKVYTITFVANGKIIASYKLSHGETVTIPTAPKIENDGKYSYEFIGWNADARTAVGNAEYVAVYKATELPPKEPNEGIMISASVMRLIIAAVAFTATFILAVIPGTVIGVVLFHRYKRIKISSKKQKDGSLSCETDN